ncbi:MAG: DUF3971 domain-containing protein [Pseudomonadota bacterium]
MRHVSRLKRFIWYSAVGLLVTLAVLVTVARLSISYVSDYRERFEQLAGEYLGQPVVIGSMDARLVGLKPSVLLHDVSLREKDSLRQMAEFSQINISLNPLSSLRHFSPIVDLTVSGANLVVIQKEDDTFSLQGVGSAQQVHDAETGSALSTWFLSQTRVALEESRIIWRNDKTGRDIDFNEVNIELQNQQTRHRLNAAVKLPGELGKEFRFALDIEGNLLNRRDWVGEMYLKVSQLQPGKWLKDIDVQGFRFEQGSIDLEAWSRWQGGELEMVEGEIDLSALRLSGSQGKLPFRRVAGQFRFDRDIDGWQLQLQRALLQDSEREAEPFRLQVRRQEGRSLFLGRNLDIKRLMLLAKQWPGLEPEQRKELTQLQPAGLLEAVSVELVQGSLQRAYVSLQGATVAAGERLPGVERLNARLRYDGSDAVLDIDSDALSVTLPQLFAKPLRLKETKGRLRASRQGQGWHVMSEHFEVTNDDVSLMFDMSLQLQPDEVPLIALAGRFSNGRADAVADYLPVRIMPDETATWLSEAFLGGRVENGELLVHGKLEPSLLHDLQGQLAVNFDVQDVTFKYHDDWPLLHDINGAARFTGVGMAFDADSARIYRSSLGPTRVRLPRFMQPVLRAEGRADASTGDALRFLRESPLSDTADDFLAKVKGEGSTPVHLQMTIPLTEKASVDSPLAIDGRVGFRNSRLQIAPGIELDELGGELAFSEKSFNATNIVTKMYGYPATVNVFSNESGAESNATTVVAIQGHASAESLQEAFKSPLLEYMNGETDWQARLSLAPGTEGGAMLDIFSSLDGMALSLPEPMSKGEDEVQPLAASLVLAGSRAGIGTLSYGGKLMVKAQQDGLMGRLQRMALWFGSEREPELPEQEVIHISGSISRFDWAPWQKLIEAYTSDGESVRTFPLVVRMQRLHVTPSETAAKGSGRLNKLPSIDLHIKSFSYKDTPIGEVAFLVEPKARSARITNIAIAGSNLNFKADGGWIYGGESAFKFDLASSNLGDMLTEMGFASVIKNGDLRLIGRVKWAGSPMDFSLQGLGGEGHVIINDGVIEKAKPGAGKLLGLLSLEALPRRLFMDFSDISEEGIQFKSIEGDLSIRDGSVFTENMVLKSLSADALLTGRTGLVAKDFDQLLTVVPNVSGTVSVAGALAWGPQVAAALILLQEIFKSDISAATMIRYKISGSWENPEINRLEPQLVEDEDTQ